MFSRCVSLFFLKEPHIDTETYKNAIQGELFNMMESYDEAANEVINSIFKALNEYMLSLAERQIRLAFYQAQKEVDDLHQRTREGLETARLNGKQIGIRKGTTLITKKSIKVKELILKYNRDFGGCLNDKETMKLIGISKNSYYKYKRELISRSKLSQE